MAEQSQVSTIRSRIAALNIEEVHAPSPGAQPAYSYEQAAAKKKPPPPPPPSQRPPVPQRQQTINNPPIFSNAPTSARQVANLPVASKPDAPKVSPALPPRPPPRNNSKPPPPSLPPRSPSEHGIRRRDSNESISTIASGISTLSIGSAKYGNGHGASNGTLYQVRAPAYDPSKLPPLPPKKAPEDPKQSKATLKAMRSTSNVVSSRALPPTLPSRPPLPARQDTKAQEPESQRSSPALPARPALPVRSKTTAREEVQPQRSQTLPPPRRSALSFGMNKSTENSPPIPTSRPPHDVKPAVGVPPPIPLASRPNLDAIMASKPKPGAIGFCLKCRNFSAPDNHSAQFPRQNLPSSDVGWLSRQLTAPFSSPTDKARVIFTWLHHNVEYDCHSFFGGTVSATTPEATITSGLAVCSGYAGLFCALALKSGLECVVISGASKGFGHTPLKPGEPLPAFKSTHAWNAVRIDNGEWKLIDSCWGAGNVKGRQGGYEKMFNPSMFTMDNNEFGCKHYPTDERYFFRLDGRVLPWEEYLMDDVGERVTVYGGATTEHGLGERTFEPKQKQIKVKDPHAEPMIRFQFASLCSHWDNAKHGKGKPYVMVLHVGGRDGRKTDWLAFQTDGRVWWLDINRVELGCPGQKVSIFAVTSFDDRDARGLSYADYQAKKGRVGMGFGGVAMWELVESVPISLQSPIVSSILGNPLLCSLGINAALNGTAHVIAWQSRISVRLNYGARGSQHAPTLPYLDYNTPSDDATGTLLSFRCTNMASGLIGITIVVTLQNPPNTLVQGVVAAVNPQTATLTLQNVLFPATGHRLSSYNVEGHAIADIKVGSYTHAPPPPPPPQQQHNAPLPPQPSFPQFHQGHGSHVPPVARQAAEPFVDPAILSMGKRTAVAPRPTHAVADAPLEAPATPIKPPISSASAAPLPVNTSPFVGVAKDRNFRKPSAATLEGPFSSLDIADAEEPDSDDAKTVGPAIRRVSLTKTRTGKPMDDPNAPPGAKPEDTAKRTRRGGKSRKKEVAALERRNGAELHSSPEAVRKGKGNGWRQTPILQQVEQPQARTPGVIGGKVGIEAANASNRKTRRQRALDAKNGWATEDATDIQDMPEFDFAENLSKFDKRTVFNQIRNEDTTADEDRLVSFNRLARPGTHGGKNLHPTENVLDNRRLKSGSNSDSEDDLSDFGSGQNSRRAMSRASTKRIPTRQGSGIQADVDVQSHSGAPAGLLGRTKTGLINRPYASSSHATGSPKPSRITTPPDSPLLDSSGRPCLRLVSTNRKCHTITPGGMLAVEESAQVEFGLTEDLIAESAGRGIAEVALSAINPGGLRLKRENPNARPVIVILAGNHRAGARAIAAARQLQERGLKVMVALLGFERTADWDRDVRRQVELFKKFGGAVRAWHDTEEALKRLHAPPELIIDALLGRHKEFDALGDEDRRTVLGIVGWANKSRAAVLAVEMPSGVGGSTGEVAILEGEPLEVRAKFVVCLGAPRSGLLKALQNGAGREPEWLIWIIDIGVNKPWKNAGVGGGKGIKFGEHWFVQARYSEETEGEGVRG
ncbi:YjeF-related protein N-terminus-domain-containing protein [Massariosphaeria phaeospora]|uniref:Enhancer of mRNA-decapping protein 3 n=1 Tax=Massariosphaeria phaeospora TaxID=100035 RepID=A0A7C8M2C9_9PLEO|nr:YjeF-related protein N-terminus-domain-containing protein [Massariosphaeria phaeospora]